MGSRRWWGQELANLEADYGNFGMTVVEVARKNRTNIGTVARLARRHKWPPRRSSAKDPRLPALKLRRYQIGKRIELYQREMEKLDHRIKFLESLSGKQGQ